MKKPAFVFVLLLCLCAVTAVASDHTMMPMAEFDAPSESPSETPSAEVPIDPETGLPAVQWLGGPGPCEEDDNGGGTGGGSGTGGGGQAYVCSATFQCPGSVAFGIQPYTISCQGAYSCQTFSCGIKCDGNGIGCIPGPMC